MKKNKDKQSDMWEGAVEIREDLEELESWSGTWPPSLDDLQNIIEDQTEDSIYDIILDLSSFVDEETYDYLSKYFSNATHLWLAYIMAICHAKFWNGDKWVSPENA